MPAKPPVTSVLGRQVAIVLTTPPADDAAPTLTEINAGLFIACHTIGQLTQQPEQESGAGPRHTCETSQDTRLGPVTWPLFDLQYSYRPQDAGTPGGVGNEVYEALVPGIEVRAYFCDGLDAQNTDALVSGDVINRGFICDVGQYREGPSGDDNFAEFAVMQALAAKGGLALHNYAAPAA